MSDERPMLTQSLEQEHKRLQHALRESELLRELSALLASSLDLSHVLRIVAKRTVEVCGVERCAVWLHEEARSRFVPKTYHLVTRRVRQKAIQTAEHLWQSSSLPLNSPVMQRLFQQNGMLFVENLTCEPDMERVAAQFLVHSVLLIALRREGRIVGMMSLDNPGLSTTFTPEQQQLACAIGQQAAIAIDNARLYQQAQEERKRVERLIGRAQAIYHVAMAMNSDEELPAVLGLATQHLVSGLDAQGGAIALLDHDALILASTTNLRPHAPTLSPPLAQLTQCRRAIIDNAPRFVMNEDFEDAERTWYQQLGMNNVLIVPLVVGSPYRSVFEGKRPRRKSQLEPEGRQCVGFAFVNYTNNQQPPSGGQNAFAQDLAAQCAIAIDKNAILARTRQSAMLATERANTLDAVFDALTEGIMVLNMDGEIVVNNNIASRFLGMPLYAKRPLALFLRSYPTYTLYGQPIAYEDFPLTRALQGEHIRGERFVTHRADKAERVIEVNVSPLLNDENQQVAIVCAFRDVTEQVHFEQRTRNALNLMLNAVEVISGVIDVEELLQRLLKMTVEAFRCSHGDIFLYDEVQQSFIPFHSEQSCDAEDMLHVNALFSLEPTDLESREPFASLYAGHATVWSTRTNIPGTSTPSPQKSLFLLAPITHDSHFLGAIALKQQVSHDDDTPVRDFTMWDIAVIEGIGQFAGLAMEQVRWQAEAETARSREEAMRQANSLKDQFLSITAHEFRTPLTIIQTHSQLVARLLRKLDAIPKRERLLDGLTSIEEQTRQLTNIVNTFLEVTRINKGQVSLTVEEVDVLTLVKQTIAAQSAMTKKHTFSCDVEDASLPYHVMGDSARLSQVFTNLLQNAVKYSPLGGPISVTLKQRYDEQHKCAIEVCIADKGIGVPVDAQQRLFECFYRAPNAQTGETRGVGLGLYVVAEVLRLHGGTIRVESSGEYGEGSRFILTLPMLESETQQA